MTFVFFKQYFDTIIINASFTILRILIFLKMCTAPVRIYYVQEMFANIFKNDFSTKY